MTTNNMKCRICISNCYQGIKGSAKYKVLQRMLPMEACEGCLAEYPWLEDIIAPARKNVWGL